MLVEEDEEEHGEEEHSARENVQDVGEKGEAGMTNMKISLNSLVGLQISLSRFCWGGGIQGRVVVVLVDSGALGNFLVAKIAKELQMKVKIPTFTIEVGNGQREKGDGVCCGVELRVQGITINQNFFLMEMGGTRWCWAWIGYLALERFKQISRKWPYNGRRERTFEKSLGIVGDPSLCKGRALWKATLQVLKEDGEGYLVSPWQEAPTKGEEVEMPSEIRRLMHEFSAIFQAPKGLPLRREYDHAIVLKEGAAIPNIQPYRYPYCQKIEIEKIVNEMLQAGIIQDSVSPFCSLVILVKKKDGGWRFCVDYRALNEVTIPDKFPIPIIEDLLMSWVEVKFSLNWTLSQLIIRYR